MKKRYLLLLLFVCPAILIHAQRKSTFGLVLKTGNYMFPGERNVTPPYLLNATKIEKHQPGISYVFGMYHQVKLGRHFGFSTELLYRFNNYAFSTETISRFPDPSDPFDSDIQESLNLSENSLSLPFRIHYSFLKNGRTSVALGVGASRIFSTEKIISSLIKYLNDPSKDSHYTSAPQRNTFSDFGISLTMTAGLYHQISDNTTLGLEFNFERNRHVLYGRLYEDYIYIECLCQYGYPSVELPNLENMAVTLRHNLLR